MTNIKIQNEAENRMQGGQLAQSLICPGQLFQLQDNQP